MVSGNGTRDRKRICTGPLRYSLAVHIDEITIETKPLGIPYSRPETDPASHSYVNLRNNSELLDSIPELRRELVLKKLVAGLNSTGSPFETFGCEACMRDWTDEQLPGFKKRKGCRVDMAYLDRSRCTAQSYRELIDGLRKFERIYHTYDVMMVYPALQPAYVVSEGSKPFYILSLWLFGVGRSEQEAEKWCGECVEYMYRFLMEKDRNG